MCLFLITIKTYKFISFYIQHNHIIKKIRELILYAYIYTYTTIDLYKFYYLILISICLHYSCVTYTISFVLVICDIHHMPGDVCTFDLK